MAEEKKEEFKDYFLSINGKCMLPKQLTNGHNYKIETDIILTDQNEKIDKKTGDKYLYYKGELDGVATIKNDKGQMMYSKDRRSESQLMRGQIFNEGREYKDDMPIIRHLYNPHIIELIDKYKRGELE